MKRYWSGLIAIAATAALGGCGNPAPRAPRDGPAASNIDVADKDVPPTAAQTAAPDEDKQSIFTSLDLTQCRLIEENLDEGGYSRHDCPGSAGYRIEVVESDLRQSIAVRRPDGTKDDLAFSGLAGGGGFSVIGRTVEWRGDDPARPRTLTVRFNVNESPEPAVPPRSYLIVIRLAAPACPVAAIAPGPTQSAEARRIADAKTLPACRR